MSNLVNKVQLIGNIGNEPEVLKYEEDKKRIKFSFATNEHYRNTEGEKEANTQWHNIVAFDKVAKILENNTKKGTKLLIEGKIIYQKYTGEDQITRNYTSIIAKSIYFLDNKKEESNDNSIQ